MNNLKSRSISILLGILFPVFLFAQSENKLVGYVKDVLTQKPMEGVHIKIGSINKNTVSDRLGYFEIDHIPNGDYTLVATSVGYQTLKQKVFVNATTNLTLNMEEKSENLSEVVVTGTRTEKSVSNSPIITHIIKAKDIENLGVNTVLEAIQLTMPNIHFSPDPHGDNLQMQGLGNDYILVLIDGQRLVGEMRGNVDFSRIPTANIKQIEVITSAASVLYGSNAIGGVINIITKGSDDKLSGTIETRYGSYNELFTQLSGGSHIKNTDIRFSAYRKSHDGYDLTPKTSPNSYTFNPFKDISGEFIVRQDITKKIKAKANFNYYQHHLNNPSVSFEKEHRFTNAYTGGLDFNAELTDKNSLEITLHKDFAQRFSIVDADNSKSKKGHYDYNSIQAIDRQNIGENNLLLVGFEYTHENVFSTTFSKETNQERTANTLNGFVQADFTIGKQWELIAGGRYTYHKNYGSAFTPSLSLLYKWNAFRFRTNIAKGYRSPSLKEMHYNFDHGGFWIIGNPDLKPEKSLYTSLSAEYAKKGLSLTVNLFQNSVKNKIHYYMADNKTRAEMHYRNYDETEVRGVEFSSKYRFLKNYTTRLGYTYTSSKDKKTGLQLRGNVKHSLNLILGYESRQLKNPFSVNISGRMNSGRVYEEIVTRYIPAIKKQGKVLIDNNQGWHSLWGINANKTIKLLPYFNVIAFAGINNIGDYTDSFLITPGRTYYGGIKLQLK